MGFKHYKRFKHIGFSGQLYTTENGRRPKEKYFYLVFCPRKHKYHLAVMKTSMKTDEVWCFSILNFGMQGGKGKKFLSKSGARGRTKKGSTKFGRRKTRSATPVVLCTCLLALPFHC